MNISDFYRSQSSYSATRYSSIDEVEDETDDDDETRQRFCVVGKANEESELLWILRNDLNGLIIHSQTGQEYLGKSGIIFVVKDFESGDFNYVNVEGTYIIGPTIIRMCHAHRMKLPPLRTLRPLYCTSLRGISVAFNTEVDSTSIMRRYVALIHYMGGSARRKFHSDDIFISRKAMGEVYREAASLGMVISPKWIEECWSHRDELDFAGSSQELMKRFRLKCFQGLALFFVGFADDHDFDEVKAKTQENGGEIAVIYERATHAVFSSPRQTPFEEYSNPKIKHVTLEWFWRCISVEWCVDEANHAAYVLPPPSRPLQSRENLPAHKPKIVASPNETLQRNDNSRASLENMENSNNSSILPDNSENMYSSDNLDPTPPRSDKRYHICRELLDTEQSYIRVLEILETRFKQPLLDLLGTDGELLNKNEIQVIFAKIHPIIKVHTEITTKLQALIDDGKWHPNHKVGRVWSEAMEMLQKVYPPYVNSYNEMLEMLNVCDQQRPKFHCFIKLEESKEYCQKNSLRDMLIRPVQRIPSVLLLLQELLKKTEKSNPDQKCLKSAIEKIKKVLEKVNESRRQTDTFVSLHRIWNDIEDFPPDLISSGREFIQSLDVIVLTAGGVLERFKGKTLTFFLFNDYVVVTKCRVSTSTAYLNSTVNSFGGSGTIRERSSSTLGRQMSFRTQRNRKPYKYVSTLCFVTFRNVTVVQAHALFAVKMRDVKADELCCFQVTNGTTFEMGMEFFENMKQRVKRDSDRDILIDVLTMEELHVLSNTHPEDAENIKKGISLAVTDSSSYGALAHRPSLRRTLSNVSMGISSGLGRFTSRSRLSNIGESMFG